MFEDLLLLFPTYHASRVCDVLCCVYKMVVSCKTEKEKENRLGLMILGFKMELGFCNNEG